jgi:hypothetical protein
MLYTVTNSGIQNGRPTAIGSIRIAINYGALEQYDISTFTTGTSPEYADPEDDGLSYIKIIQLPIIGTLYLTGDIPVSLGDLIQVGTITTGNFYYQAPATGNEAGYTETWEFDAADVGSNSLSGLPDGIVTMDVAPVENGAPDVVGDRTELLEYQQLLTFTSDMFTSGTTPPYNDPEGDAPASIKILDLPADGTLIFNAVPVVVNQIISISEMDLGYMVYAPDLAITIVQTLSFNFSVSDVGSGLFTE